MNESVNPHLLRDIFAYRWLDDHPEDYATLAVILWHKDIRTTLRIYGRDFNESNGICSIDAWLRRRKPSVRVFASMRTLATQKISDEAVGPGILAQIDGLEQAKGSKAFVSP